MSNHNRVLHCCLLLTLLSISRGDDGTASKYSAPYTPKACNIKIPVDMMFAAAGQAMWNNGAACGEKYSVVCKGAVVPGICNPSHRIEVTIVDSADQTISKPSEINTTMVLSATAFGAIASGGSVSSVFINFQRVNVSMNRV